ncbi:MAG: hypothetical protein DDT32_00565 [Syntrophomonadaceae bacterium]|nr:hypothetical protein [Bacillota bacterium]MBT9146820.1 hypothetical protein [Bacillota bacterium]
MYRRLVRATKAKTGRKNNNWFLLLALIIGTLIGTTAGEIIGVFFTDKASIIHQLFIEGITPELAPREINLHILNFTFGISTRLTLSTLVGALIALYIHTRSK